MNYHSSEDSFLKVEKCFLIVVGDALCHQQGAVIKMISQSLYVNPKISILNR